MCDQLLLESYKLDKCSNCKACDFIKNNKSACKSLQVVQFLFQQLWCLGLAASRLSQNSKI